MGSYLAMESPVVLIFCLYYYFSGEDGLQRELTSHIVVGSSCIEPFSLSFSARVVSNYV